MPLNWLDTSNLSFNYLLLLERVQIAWLPGWPPEPELAIALQANPVVAWYLRHRCPEVAPWLDRVAVQRPENPPYEAVRQAEQTILQSLNDLLVYAIDPSVYDAQPFLNWDSAELTGLADFKNKVVIDVGAGTGRLTFVVAPLARVVFAVEPVGNLRRYLREKAAFSGLRNVYPVDGLIEQIPFPDHFADVIMGGHVFGDAPEMEIAELERVTCPGGMVILCPGNADADNLSHAALVRHGYNWSRFKEPRDGWKRKYWRVMET